MSVIDKMKSIFKKDEGKQPSSPVRPQYGGGPKIWTMPPAMQKEFEKGVRYNMKVIIRGIRRTGKSALLARLHGHTFPEAYTPSPEISAATIRFQSSEMPEEHGVKVEIWDVVDSGIASSITTVSPLFSKGGSQSPSSSLMADATNIDVYRGCQCAIFMVDPLRRESLDYVANEAKHVPGTCAILLALNFMDIPKAQHVVTELDVDAVCRGLPRSSTPMIFLASQGNAPERSLSASASWVSISARTGHGISVLQSFFEIPVSFVHLTALETQMKGIYQKIEQHQAWMLSERARLNYEVRERTRGGVTASPAPAAANASVAHPRPAQPQEATAPAGLPVAVKAPPKGETILITLPSSSSSAAAASNKSQPTAARKAHTTVSAPQKSRPAHDDSDSAKLSNDFFGDISSDDDGSRDRSSSSDEDDAPQASTMRRFTGGPTVTNSPKEATPTAAHQQRAKTAPANETTATAQKTLSAPGPSAAPLQTFRVPTMSTQLRADAADRIKDQDLVVEDVSAKVDDGFFGDDSSEEDDEGPHPLASTTRDHSDSDDNSADVPLPSRAPVLSAHPATGLSSSPPPLVKPPAETRQPQLPEDAVDDGFFGGDDSEEDANPKPPQNKSAPSVPTTEKTPSSDSDEEAPKTAHAKRVAPQGSSRRPGSSCATASSSRPVVTAGRSSAPPAAALGVDIAALLAQMQSAIAAAPTVDGDDIQRKKDKREKKERRDKASKKEKRSSKKAAAASSGDDDDDGGFVVES